MGLNSMGLGFVFTAKDLATGSMKRIEGRFKSLDATTEKAARSFTQNVGKMVAGLGVMAAGAAALGGAFNLAGQFGQYERELARVGAITRATEADLQMLGSAAIKAGIETQFSPHETVQALGELGSRGFTAAESTFALGGALDFAAGGSIGVAQGAATMAASLRVFGLEAGKATYAADRLLKISNLTAIQAHELELMIGTVSRGASAARQSLDEMLASMGLVKNTGVDASVAASSVSSALQFIAKNQDDFKALGVEVSDATGEFRPFLDIVMDTEAALNKKFSKTADKVSKGLELFGRFGVAAFQAITTQVKSGVLDTEGNLHKMGDAVAYLRKEMKEADGTAQKFKERLLDTFEGQKTLLEGIWQTLGVVSGEAFAMGFRPVIEVISTVITKIIEVIQKIPAPIKRGIGIFFVLTASLVAVAGAVLAAVAAFALIKVAVVAFAGPLIAAATAIGGVVAAGLVLAGLFKVLRMAFDQNIGRFGDRMRSIYDKVKLFFDAIGQLTSGDGKLRGDVLKKLVDPANAGVLTMVQRFQQLKFRIEQFFVGLKEGFQLIMETAGPTFDALGEAFTELAAALGFSGKAFGLMDSKSSDWKQTGQTIGELVGDLTRLLLAGLTMAIRVATGMITGFKVAWAILKYPLLLVYWVLRMVLWVVGALTFGLVDITEAGNEAGGMWDYMAKVVGFALGIFIAYKGVLIAVRTAILVYRGVLLAAAAAQALFSGAAGMSAFALLGPAGLVLAALAVGVAVGRWIDNMTGASDAIADWLSDITGLTAELNQLDEAYRKTLKTRGQIARFDGVEAAAKARGMTVAEHVEERATKIASESTAKRLGLSKDEIARRLIAGEEIYKELAPKGPEAGAQAVQAKAAGEADKSKAAERAQADAFEAALQRADEQGRPVKFQANLKIDSQQVASVMKEAQRQGDALDFEADLGVAGGF